MRIFLTGGSGFVGGHTIEALAGQHEVLALARSDKAAAAVRALGATPVRGELGAVAEADLAGVDAIVHSAAFVEEWGTREQYWTVNVDGTAQLLKAARAAGVPRFVHIGTEAAVFDGTPLVDVDERRPPPRVHRYLYSESKAAAEQLVLSANAPGFTTLSLRPRLIWGPRDTTLVPVFRRMVAEGGWTWVDGGAHRTSATHVHNLTHAIGLALTRGRGGEAYFIVDDERTTYRELFTAIGARVGLTFPDRSIPGWLARPAATLVEGTWRTLGLRGPPPLTAFAVHMLANEVTLQGEKARADLLYRPVVSREAGLASLTA